MNLRTAASNRSGNGRWCVPTIARSLCAWAAWSWQITALTGLAPTQAAEPAPMPSVRQDDPLQFRPRTRASLGNSPLPAGEADNSERFSGDPAIRGLEPGGNEVVGSMPEAPFALTPPQFFRGPQERYSGPGRPLIQESWSFRPFSIAGIFGFVQGSPLIDDWVRENQGVLGGVQLGWDCEHYWGFETRFAWAEVEVVDSDRAIAAQVANDDAAGLAPDDRFRHRFDGRRNNHVFFWDAHALFYPWGDSAWRPYLMMGVGATAMSFIDRTDVSYKDTLFTVPVGAGVKYRVSDFIAVRMEAADYMAFGGGQTLELIHNVTITGGIEFHFGGPRRAYWPWNPGRHYW